MSRDRFFIVWVSIELNMFIFIGLLLISGTSRTEIMKYFLIQRIASRLFLILLLVNIKGFFSISVFFIFICMAIKLGVAPFHVWFVQFIEKSSWLGVMLVRTAQKIIPLYVMGLIFTNYFSYLYLTVLVALLGRIGQISIKKILAYSSVFGLSWLIAIKGSFTLAFLFLRIYGVGLLGVISRLSVRLSPNLSVTRIQHFRMGVKTRIIVNLLRMGGFPPLLGFVLKVLVVTHLLRVALTRVRAILVQASIVMLYIYTRSCVHGFIQNLSSGISVINFSQVRATTGVFLLLRPALVIAS